jgi:YD repeat-containing protein
MPPEHTAYIYDKLGRLLAVIHPTGNTARYEYDSAGNLLGISRGSSSFVSIIQITPNTGSAGTLIAVHGTGFSPTASENGVTFNGVPAVLVSATGTQIVTNVPSGAVSGPITINTPTGSATSGTVFTVLSAIRVPSINGFSPKIGNPGTTVTINGTNFDATPASNNVIFNRTFAIIDSATGTGLETQVPLGTTSGRITITTQSGTTTSSEDFFIPPDPRTPTDVEFTGRMTVGQSQRMSITTPNKIGLVVFDASAAQRVNVGISEVSFGGSIGVFPVSLLGPHGTTLATKLVGRFGEDIDTEPLPETGTYTIMVDPEALTVDLTVTLSEPVIASLSVDGPSVPVAINSPGQDARLTFEGVAGQRVDLGVSEVSFGPGSGAKALETSILHSNETTLVSRLVISKGRGIHTDPLPDSGIYTVVIDPHEAKTVSLTLTLSEPIIGALTVDGPSVPVSLRPGQTARLTFEGEATQQLRLGITEVSFGTGELAVVSVLKPDGSTLITKNVGTIGHELNIDSLPDTGTYVVVIDPEGSSISPGATTARLTLGLLELDA